MSSTKLISDLDPTIFSVGRFKPVRPMKEKTVGDGDTWLCHDDFLDQNVVVKLIGEIAVDNLMRLHRDALILCKSSNKGLAKLIDFGATACGIGYLVYDYIPGENFRVYLDEQQPLSLQHTFKAFLPVVEALGSMHSNGMLHWDLRCSNLLLVNSGSVESTFVLLNSATGRLEHGRGEPITIEGRQVFGSARYMAPEQAVLNEYDVRSEIFALGCTLFEAITGRTPYVGEPEDAVSRMIRRGAPSLAQVSEGLSYPQKVEGLIAKFLAKNPDSRFQTMQEVRNALRELSSQALRVEQKAPPSDKPGRQDQRFNPDSGQPNEESQKQTVGPAVGSPESSAVTQNSYTQERDHNGIRLVIDDSDMEKNNDAVSDTITKLVSGVEQQPEEKAAKISPTNSNQLSTQPSQKAHANNSAFTSTSGNKTTLSNSPLNAPVATFNGNFLVTPTGLLHNTPQSPPWWERLTANSSKGQQIMLGILCVTPLCLAWSVLSYANFLSAPRVKADGVIVYYKPASLHSSGLIELNAPADGTILPIVIDKINHNIPPIPDADWNEDSTMQTNGLWGQESVSPMHIYKRIKRPIDGIRLGEPWTMEYRIENGKMYLEDCRYDSFSESAEGMDDVAMTLTTMLNSIPYWRYSPYLAAESKNQPWASEDFETEIDLTVTDLGAARDAKLQHPFSTSADMKLISLGKNDCNVLIRSPFWLRERIPFLIVSLTRHTTWQVTRINPSTLAVWNRDFEDLEE